MTIPQSNAAERRVLLLPPTRKDGELTSAILRESGIYCEVCSSLPRLLDSLSVAAGAVILAEEVLEEGDVQVLDEAMAHQPPWSDLPVLLLTWQGADSPEVVNIVETLPNITLLERPLRIGTLVSTVRAALRARERQYQIRGQIEAIRDGDRRKDEFLATLAHELRNPLAPIRNAAQMLKLCAPADPSIQHLQQIMERQINHMVRLVDDLMEVSRITRGKIDLRKEPVDIATVLQSAIETSQPLIDAGRHPLTLSVPNEPLVVNGDLHRLAQVFSNLLNNAAKYSDEGGPIWLSARRSGDGRVEVSVRDQGMGVEAAMLPHIFELFAQAEVPKPRAQAGLGIGLALVRRLVDMHDGAVQAFSDGRGRGSEFVVSLPFSATSGAAASKPARIDGFTFPHRVLVVDDNQDSARTLGELFEHLGATVRVVFDGQSALDAIAAERPAVVFLDIGMPGMDGYEVARRIRQDGRNRHVMLVAVTGWSQQRDRRRAHAAGFDHHLVKPIDLAALQTLLAGFHERGLLVALAPHRAVERQEGD